MWRVIASLVFIAGCGVEIDGGGSGSHASNGADAGTTPTDDSGITTTGGGDGGTPYAMLCLAKGYTASTIPGSFYRASTGQKQWADAATECNADVPGSTHLIVLSSMTEVTYAKSHLGWIGLSDRATEGMFKNVTNETPDARPFNPGQPDNGSGSEDCVQQKTDGLDDDQCNNDHPYTCECDGRAATP